MRNVGAQTQKKWRGARRASVRRVGARRVGPGGVGARRVGGPEGWGPVPHFRSGCLLVKFWWSRPSKTPPKFHEKTPRERQRTKWGKKSAKFWALHPSLPHFFWVCPPRPHRPFRGRPKSVRRAASADSSAREFFSKASAAQAGCGSVSEDFGIEGPSKNQMQGSKQ